MPAKPAMHESDVRAHMGRELKRNSQKAVEDARQRLTSTSGTRSAFDFELIDEYANSRLASVLAVPALVLILAVFASLWVSPLATAGWAALVVFTNSATALLCRRFKRADPGKFNASRWTTTFVIAETVLGVA